MNFYTGRPYLYSFVRNLVNLYGNASVTFRKSILFGCIRALLRSASKYLNFLSSRLLAPTVMNPYRLG